MADAKPHGEDLRWAYQQLSKEFFDAKAEIAALKLERDLAIAHDRQPYPTAWAYEQVCKALENAKKEIAALRHNFKQYEEGAEARKEKMLADIALLNRENEAMDALLKATNDAGLERGKEIARLRTFVEYVYENDEVPAYLLKKARKLLEVENG